MLHRARKVFGKYLKELTTICHKFGQTVGGISQHAFYAFQYRHVLTGRRHFSDERDDEVRDRVRGMPKKKSFDPISHTWSED